MKLTEQQKERYITACKSAICRCLIPNVTKITMNLNNVKKPTLKVFTRGAGNEDDFHLEVVLTDANSMHLYFKTVKFLYGETILGIALEPSAQFCAHISRIIDLIISHEYKDQQDLGYEFGVIPGYLELAINNKNWHSLENLDDLRFAPMDLERVLNEDDK